MFTHRFSSQSAESLLSDPSTFAVITFNGRCQASTPGLIHSGLHALSEQESEQEPEQELVEVWQIPGAKVVREQRGHCHISRTDKLLCAAVWASQTDCLDIEQAAQQAYTRLIDIMRDTGFIYPIRFWNYLPRINEGEGDLEEYKKFCEGRLTAFTQSGYDTQQFPAASALGHDTDSAVFFVFASKQAGQHFENPAQEKAYHYPREYGKSRPSFARATAFNQQQHSTLFVSGTASILGHQTIHVEATKEQVGTTISNINTLLEHTGRSAATLQSLKVYVRKKEEFKQVKNIVQSHYPDVATLYTRADICRANLLVEIEAHCQ